VRFLLLQRFYLGLVLGNLLFDLFVILKHS
jgi:hypothetical protein